MNDYEKVLEDAKVNDDIIGLILVGSRGKGFENEHSDYDMVMVVKDEAAQAVYDKYEPLSLENVDLNVYSLTNFREHAGWESPDAWDRYNYTHVKVLVDKTTDLPELIKEKGYIPEEKRKEFIEYWIDGYVNGVFRSVKCIKNGNQFGAHLEAVNSILDLLTLIFGINGRHRPFLGYVAKELETYPLEHLPWSPPDFIAKIEKVLESADLETQQELLKGIEQVGRGMGYGHMFDGWEGKDQWTMTFKS